MAHTQPIVSYLAEVPALTHHRDFVHVPPIFVHDVYAEQHEHTPVGKHVVVAAVAGQVAAQLACVHVRALTD
jgi:hypothetical protein